MPALRRSFLNDIDILHGPVGELGRFFLAADGAMHDRGVATSFGDFGDLAATNRANRSSWYPLLPPFDTDRCYFDPATTFCLTGRNRDGEIVATISGKLQVLTDTTLADATTTMRFFYDDPERDRRPGESCRMSAPAASHMSGNVVYIGAAWYRPDFRKLGLPTLFSRVARAHALARWGSDFTVGFMSEGVVKSGLMRQTGHAHLEWSLDWLASALGDLRLALVWLEAPEVLDDISSFTAALQSGAIAVPHERRA